MDSYRILIVDDNRNIHDDFCKILAPPVRASDLDDAAAELFGDAPSVDTNSLRKKFELSSAFQGKEALDLVSESLEEQRPFAVAFVDMRMPPGWDGLETIQALWEVEKELHTIICTAHSDHSWLDIVKRLGASDRLLVIKKPFDAVEVIQCAHAMCEKWRLQRLERLRMEELEGRVAERTAHLELAKKQLEQEMLERQKMELELRQAQKLEAVGQLAAGIAHEINTPIQFVGNSLDFLREGFQSTLGLLQYHQEIAQKWHAGESYAAAANELQRREEEADIEYIIERSPAAFERTRDGINRVARIVRAMKEFAHPGTNEQQPADLNHAIETTLEVARGEYKSVADIELELGELPLVICSIGDVNQVLLNLLINASHAVADAVETKGRGTIHVSTRLEGSRVMIRISDTGNGVPEHLRHKVFDPFFTTKAVGKGTGHGLALAHAVIVERHGGSITLEPSDTGGATFLVSLPVSGNALTSRAS